MSLKQVKISKELYDQIQKLADKSKRSIREIVEEAVKVYILGSEGVEKNIKSVSGKIIALQYTSRCRVCRKEIKQGELAYWVKYVYSDNTTRSYVICLDCYYRDTALADQYLKKRRLEIVIRGLKKKADELADMVEKLKIEYDINRVKAEAIELYRTFDQFLANYISNNEDINKIREFIERQIGLFEKINEIETTLSSLVHVRGKRVKKVSEIREILRR